MSKSENIDNSKIEKLIKDLKNYNRGVRWESAEELEKLGWEPRNDREKVLYLIAKYQFVEEKWNEIIELGEIGFLELIKDLEHCFLELQWCPDDPDAVSEWIIIEEDEIVEKIEELLIQFGNLGVELLIRALEDDSWYVQMKAADILGKIGDKRAIKPLNKLLKEGIITDEKINSVDEKYRTMYYEELQVLDEYVRKAADFALRRIKKKIS